MRKSRNTTIRPAAAAPPQTTQEPTVENALQQMIDALAAASETLQKVLLHTRGTQPNLAAKELDFSDGTGPHTLPIFPEPPRSLSARVLDALKDVELGFDDLVTASGESPAKVSLALVDLSQTGQIYNVGTEDDPKWLRVIGDECSPSDLRAVITRLLKLREWTFSDLQDATGARRSRVSGVLIDLERTGAKLVKTGAPRMQRYRLH